MCRSTAYATSSRRTSSGSGPGRVSHVYCPECGFQNLERECAKCGALLAREAGGETTMSMPANETPEELGALDETISGPALVVRSGGGRAETFRPAGDRTLIGRSPSATSSSTT